VRELPLGRKRSASSAPFDLQLHSISHGVVLLEQLAIEYGAERRRLRVVKMRGIQFRGGFHDFTIIKGGLDIFPRLVAAEHHASFVGEFTPSGNAGLDQLLGGGLERGTNALLIGAAGVGKSSVALTYALSAANRDEHTAYFAFDEGRGTLEGRARTLGLALQPALDSGKIRLQQIDPAELSPGEFAAIVKKSVETKPLGEGTGLGLSMIYGFARPSGGQVRIYSEIGNGTTMCIYLPRHDESPKNHDSDLDSSDLEQTGDGQTVLMIDDEPTIRMLIAEVLSDAGYKSLEAADGNAGLRILQSSSKIDLLITDVGLPGGMNGRSCRRSAGIPPGPKSSLHNRLCGKRGYWERAVGERHAGARKAFPDGRSRSTGSRNSRGLTFICRVATRAPGRGAVHFAVESTKQSRRRRL
jgi:KaiC/GvpD/RAD55 family RecA-like ATPase